MPELSDSVKSKIKSSFEGLYAEIQSRDTRESFRLEETSGDASVSFERYKWVNRGRKHSHRYCVRASGEKPFRTKDFDLAFFVYYSKLNSIKSSQNAEKP